jgi:hypothetical protein
MYPEVPPVIGLVPIVRPPPPPLPQAAPVPLTTPLLFACKHCVEPVTLVVSVLVAVSVENVPAAGVVPPIAGGVAALAVANVPKALPFASFALTMPLPENVRVAPVPTVIVAVVFVLVDSALKALLPPLPQPEPASTITPVADHCTQCPDVTEPLYVVRLAPRNELAPVPPRAIGSNPLEMFPAFVVSVVADGANTVPLVFVQVIAVELVPFVQSPVSVPALAICAEVNLHVLPEHPPG